MPSTPPNIVMPQHVAMGRPVQVQRPKSFVQVAEHQWVNMMTVGEVAYNVHKSAYVLIVVLGNMVKHVLVEEPYVSSVFDALNVDLPAT